MSWAGYRLQSQYIIIVFLYFCNEKSEKDIKKTVSPKNRVKNQNG